MQHRDFLIVERHMIAAADAVGFDDFETEGAGRAGYDRAQVFAERVPNTVKRSSRKRPTISRLSIALVVVAVGE